MAVSLQMQEPVDKEEGEEWNVRHPETPCLGARALPVHEYFSRSLAKREA
jgi:hypothetical protein